MPGPIPTLVNSSFLPPAFELIPRLLLLLDDPDVNSDAIADVIRLDPGITADLLHASNSAFSGGSARIETVRDALLQLGLRQVCRIVLRIIISPVLSDPRHEAVQRLDLWKHSLACAIGAQLIARKARSTDPELAFTTGLLHDIGKIRLALTYGHDYLALVEQAKRENEALFLLERESLQNDHAQAGGRLLQEWNFPESIAAAIEAHHDPARSRPQAGSLAAIAAVANILAYRISHGYGFPPYAVDPEPALLAEVSLESDSLPDLGAELEQALEQEQARFR